MRGRVVDPPAEGAVGPVRDADHVARTGAPRTGDAGHAVGVHNGGAAAEEFGETTLHGDAGEVETRGRVTQNVGSIGRGGTRAICSAMTTAATTGSTSPAAPMCGGGDNDRRGYTEAAGGETTGSGSI